MVPEIGIITEQNDLAMGFNPLNETDAGKYSKAESNTNKDSDKNTKDK